jgi:hypothetical protein
MQGSPHTRKAPHASNLSYFQLFGAPSFIMEQKLREIFVFASAKVSLTQLNDEEAELQDRIARGEQGPARFVPAILDRIAGVNPKY